jgi:hypothetical protein
VCVRVLFLCVDVCAVGDSEAHDISRVFLLSIIQGTECDGR